MAIFEGISGSQTHLVLLQISFKDMPLLFHIKFSQKIEQQQLSIAVLI